MTVTVIDEKRKRAIICSFAEAARTIGVCSKTISRWSIDRKSEHFNCFTIYFDTEIIKQPKRGKCLV